VQDVTLLVGLSPDARDDAGGAVGLAGRLALAWGEDVTVAVVVTPGSEPDDPGDPAPDGTTARAAVEGVLAEVGLTARWVTVRGRSVAGALLEAAGAPGTTAVVLGTDPDRSGRIAVRVAHESPVPVVLARGPAAVPGAPITRVTCAFDGTAAARDVLAAAADLATRSSASLRVASFAVRRPAATPTRGESWTDQIAAAQASALEEIGRSAETGVHSGTTWDAAVHDTDWGPGDLLVVGGSPGIATRFFLGDRLGAILQAAPVPAVIVRSGSATPA
jgi:nucleotide-binding universal stress UspA family protein